VVSPDDFDTLYSQDSVPLQRNARRNHRTLDIDEARRVLKIALSEDPPPSMHEIARRLDYQYSFLVKRLPDECRAISELHRAFVKTQSIQRKQAIYGQIREATLQVHAQGQYPSQKRVSALLDQPGSIREPGAGEVWHATLRELGWEG